MTYATELSDHYAAVRRRLAPEPPPPRIWQPPAPGPEPEAEAEPVAILPISAVTEPERFARALLDALAPPLRQRACHDVVRTAARLSGLTVPQMLYGGKTHKRVRPRQIAMTVCVLGLRRSLPDVGRVFKRHHTTILHALRKWRDVIEPIMHEYKIRGQIMDEAHGARAAIAAGQSRCEAQKGHAGGASFTNGGPNQ